jgi:hypothetical protein
MKSFHRARLVFCAAICTAASCVFFANAMSVAAQAKSSANKKSAPAVKPSAAAQKKTSAAKTLDKTKNSEKSKAAEKSKTSDKSKTAAKTSSGKKNPPAKTATSSKEKTAAAKSSIKSVAAPKTTKTAATKIASAKTVEAKKTATAKTSAEKSTAKPKASEKPIVPEKAAISPRQLPAQIVVNVTSARARSAPDQNANVVSTLNVGQILPVAEENGSWYSVKLAGDKQAWISKQIALEYSDARRTEIYRSIAAKYLKGKMDFATAAQVFEFLTAAAAQVKDLNAQGDFHFKRFQTLATALKAVPFGKGETESPYKTFLKANEKEVVYSEPAGEWYVRSDAFWETHARYKDLPVGEEIAHLAAETPLPGECEGYVNCYLYLMRVTDGEYLNFYPNGKYARKSVQRISSMLEPIVADLKGKSVYLPPSDISDRAEFNRLLTELRQIISKVPYPEKARAVQQINQIGEGFR